MALNVFELFGKITIDGSGAKSGLDSAVGHAKQAESKLASTFKKVGKAVAAAFTVREIVEFGKQCTQTYATIAAEESAFTQIMGDYAGTAQQKLEAVADKTGVVSTRLTSSMTSMTAKFKGLGYNVADATTLAADGLMLASDAAAFWDMSLEDSMSHLNSFLNGSYEGGEAIGLFANDTQMAAYAIEQGIIKDTKAWAQLDEATKQATRLEYAKNMQQMSGAVGQAAKESEQYANQMANLKENWRQFQAVIGKPILEKLVLPAMKSLNKMMPGLTEAVQIGIDGLSAGFDKVASYFSEVFTPEGLNMDALPDAFSNMFHDLGAAIPGLLQGVGRAISSAWNYGVWPMIQGLFKAAFDVELPSWPDLKKGISDGWNNKVWPAIKGFFSNPFSVILPAWEKLKTNISNGWNNTVWPAIQGFFQKNFGITLPSWEQLKNDISDGWNNTVWPAVQGFFQKNFGITLPSWDQLKNDISDGWNNTVWPAIQGFFSNPFDVILPAWDQLKNDISDGWNKTIWPAIQGFFQKNFDITLPSWEQLKDDISDGWNETIWPAIQGFFQKNFDITLPSWDQLKNDISDAWNNTILPAIKGFFIKPFEVTLPSVSGMVQKIQTWWNNVKNSLTMSATATVNVVKNVLSLGGGSGSFSGRGSYTGKGATSGAMVATPDSSSGFDKFFNSHATGLDYVPYDNYYARLHKGEAVLTASEADVWRGGGNTGRVEAALTQMNDILRVIAQNTGADKQVVLDTGAVVGQLAPGIDAQLGMYSNRKGRRN